LTPVRRLEGVTYWVIENPVNIGDYVNTVLRKEWEADLRSEGRDPQNDGWLDDLLRRRWELRILGLSDIKPDSNYIHSARLKERSAELRRAIEVFGSVIWPIVVRAEGHELADGYCRYTALKEMGIRRLYAYVGSV